MNYLELQKKELQKEFTIKQAALQQELMKLKKNLIIISNTYIRNLPLSVNFTPS